MASHIDSASMLKESLDESIGAARYCIFYSKIGQQWKEFRTGGCLGYPSGVLLFSIIDSIGSYLRKDKNIVILIEGKASKINGTGWEHFKILNSKYFNQDLPEEYIKKLYFEFRNALTHNSVLGKKAIMYPHNGAFPGELQNVAFARATIDNSKNEIYIIFMLELLELCEKAVDAFKADIDSIVPFSDQGKKLNNGVL